VADVRPFRAVRYARPSAGVTAPPYDVIDDAMRETLEARDPYNVVRLTLEQDAEAAGRRYREWLSDGTLVREEGPGVWWIEQDAVGPDGVARTREGVVASLRAEPYESRSVLPHELTHRGPIEGRLRLLRATRVQLEQIFVLYEGQAMSPRPSGTPDIDVGEARLWRLDGDTDVESWFAGRQLLIADGHHRYETAVAFASEDGADRLGAVFVSTDDPGLAVYPTHRVFSGRPDIDPPGEAFASAGDALAALDEAPADEPVAVFVGAGDARLVRGADGELDVDLVDRFGHGGLSYTPDRVEAERRVAAGEADCAFLLRPPRIEDVFARARAGRPMPPKTTYFAPKLVSGLLFHPVDP
jgi:uncharacterized protein (DUF1015 family)